MVGALVCKNRIGNNSLWCKGVHKQDTTSRNKWKKKRSWASENNPGTLQQQL